ncbi:hypothetical protein [Streptomyces zingiberis]|uniref:Peptidase n=1 Tax=Streptomyces zingiberis TaxID=2053010 RepID=A0ABX1BZI9_9ACTN|nr:hypothetical protein [Streptomyces zingiberis]NJQ01880.1 hypothetical protein [Streptomyces zingiberis]
MAQRRALAVRAAAVLTAVPALAVPVAPTALASSTPVTAGAAPTPAAAASAVTGLRVRGLPGAPASAPGAASAPGPGPASALAPAPAPGQARAPGTASVPDPVAPSPAADPASFSVPARLVRAATGPGDRAGGPYCGDRDSPDFPLRAEVAGGPRGYTAGGGRRHWTVTLRNTTDRACRAVHPVAVLADRTRELAAADIEMEFHDPFAGRWRPVTLETSDRHEHIAVFDRFPGLTVPAGGTVTTSVRLRFTSGGTARPADNAVRLTLAAVQRRGDDGDWVGSAPPYDFTIRGGRTSPDGPGPAGDGTRTRPPALARSGSGGPLPWAAVAAGLCLALGAALLAASRGTRR